MKLPPIQVHVLKPETEAAVRSTVERIGGAFQAATTFIDGLNRMRAKAERVLDALLTARKDDA